MNIINSIDPVAFTIFGWPIRWYAIFITSALIICLIAATFEAKRRGINSDIVLEIFIWCVPIAVIMARIVYVLAHPKSYFPIDNIDDFYELFRINHGGLTIIGAIFGAVIGGVIVSRIRKINLLEMMDFGMPYLLLGQALGRWGNYINQEAYGHIVKSDFFRRFPLGVFIDMDNQWHYATFFYEMILNIIGFVILYSVSRKTKKRGLAAILYFVWYGIVRGLMEFIREDAVISNGIYVTQLGGFVVAAIGIVLLILLYSGKINFGISRQMHPKEIINNQSNMQIIRKNFNEIKKIDSNIKTNENIKIKDKNKKNE